MESGNYYTTSSYSGYATKGSSAYDWSLFEGRETNYVSRKNRQTTAENDRKKNGSASARSAAARKSKKALAANQKERAYRIVFGFLLVFSFGIMVSCSMHDHEVALQIEQAAAELQELQQDNEALNLDFGTIMSTPALADYAENELGMQKRESSQTEWITLGGGDVFEYTEETGFGTRFQEEADRLLSYLD